MAVPTAGGACRLLVASSLHEHGSAHTCAGFGTWNSKAAAKHFACAMLLERILEAEPSQQPLGQAQQPAPHGSETGEMSLKLLRDMPWLENAEAFPK